MADAKSETAPEAEATPRPVDDGEQSQTLNDNWQFIERVPTRDDVRALLETLPDSYGIRYVDFIDYVQALPQSVKIKRPHGENPNVKVDEYVETYSLYMSVGGRIKMLEAAATKNSWRVDFEPEPVTPTEIPGYLDFGDRIVYREYVGIWTPKGRALFEWPNKESLPEMLDFQAAMLCIGRKPGTAWVPRSGGKQAAGSNPFEKVETSARGRAIAAWGIGVLPGSGVASVEEMLSVAANRTAAEAGRGVDRVSGQTAGGIGRDEMMERIAMASESIRLARGISEEEQMDRTGKYLSESLHVKSVWDSEHHAVDWAKVKDGQLRLLMETLENTLREIRAQEQPL